MYLKPISAVEWDAAQREDGRWDRPDRPQDLIKRIEAGRHLYREGDEVHHLYEVQSGMLRLSRVMENGRRQIVAFGLPGDVVGFPDGGLHHTDCDAIGDATVAVYPRSALEDGAMDRALHRHLTRAAFREICAMQDHVMMLSSKSAADKVASVLVSLAERLGEPTSAGLRGFVPMRRVDIADFLGLTAETVCRTFTQFRADGVIALETPQDVAIADLPGLRARAVAD